MPARSSIAAASIRTSQTQTRLIYLRINFEKNNDLNFIVSDNIEITNCVSTGKYLKEKNSEVKILGVDAIGSVLKKYHETGELDLNEVSPYKIEGLGKNLIPSATDFNTIDIYEKVSDKNAALASREIVKTEGMFPGYTSGAVLQATKQYAEKEFFKKDSIVVLIFPDHGSRYMNKIYSDEWMKQQGFL